MIAVMGAAGNVGSKVADLLLQADEDVRVMRHDRDLAELRQRGADVVTGDAMNVTDLRALFSGATAALVLLPENVGDASFVEHRSLMSQAIRQALQAEAVRYVVALSAVGAARADAPGPPGGLHEFERELAALEAANVVVLRSASYMDYLLAALPMIRAQKVNGSATRGDVPLPMVATEDVARDATDRLRKLDFTGHEVRLLLGPEDVTMADATRAIGVRIGNPDVRYVQFPPDAVRAALVGAGMSAQVAGLLVDMQLALNDGRYFEGVERTAGSPTPTRLEDFLERALAQSKSDEEASA